MATSLADALFALIAVAIVVSQVFILRSTARAMQNPAAPRHAALEWAYAITPALVLVALLAVTWITMHPDAFQVEGTAPGVGIRG